VAQSTNKKVLLARFDREPVEGFVHASAGFEGEAIEILSPSGTLIKVPVVDTKAVCFVRDFEVGETWRQHRTFLARPKMPGIWVRLLFRDGDSLEGMLPNNSRSNIPKSAHLRTPAGTAGGTSPGGGGQSFTAFPVEEAAKRRPIGDVWRGLRALKTPKKCHLRGLI
jgi:hypothetical protein